MPVNDAVLMEVLDRQSDLGGVVLGSVDRKLSLSSQMVEELASRAKVHHEIELVGLRGIAVPDESIRSGRRSVD